MFAKSYHPNLRICYHVITHNVVGDAGNKRKEILFEFTDLITHDKKKNKENTTS